MNNTLKNILLLSTITIASSAYALGDIKLQRWDDQVGLVDAYDCRIEEADSTPYKVSFINDNKGSEYEQLRNSSGVGQTHLSNGSIVKLGKKKNKKNTHYVEVIGVDKTKSLFFNRWFSQRKDTGYVNNQSLLPVDDFYLKISNPDNSRKGFVYLRLLSNSNYQYLNCADNRKYYLFRQYGSLRQMKLQKLIAISEEETKLLSNIESISSEKYILKDDMVKSYETQQVSLLIDRLSSTQKEIQTLKDEADRRDDEILNTLIDDILSDLPKVSHRKKEKMEETELTKTVKTTEAVESIETVEAVETPEVTESVETETTPPSPTLSEDIAIIENSIICLPSGRLNVRDESLDKVLFKTTQGEVVQVFQSFDPENNTKSKVINGEDYNFVKVKFSNRDSTDQSIGWVVDKFVTKISTCAHNEKSTLVASNTNTDSDKNIKIKNLEDENCCSFPVLARPTHPYTSGARKFGSARGSGRVHAACDLYRSEDEPIFAVTNGEVLRNPYYFYQGTYAIEVIHDSGFVVRYGELSGSKHEKEMVAGAKIKTSQRIGYMGVVNSGCCKPMLHFELYDGSKTGSLSSQGNSYKRREDLKDPTQYLLKWENKI